MYLPLRFFILSQILKTRMSRSPSPSWNSKQSSGKKYRGPMISRVKATLRIVEQSCMFWQPVSMHTVRLHLRQEKLNRLQISPTFKQLQKNPAHLAVIMLCAFACAESYFISSNTGTPRRDCLMIPLQRAEADHIINVDFVLNGVWRPQVLLWALQLPMGKESASQVKRGVQGVQVKNSEDQGASYPNQVGQKREGVGFICRVSILNSWGCSWKH